MLEPGKRKEKKQKIEREAERNTYTDSTHIRFKSAIGTLGTETLLWKEKTKNNFSFSDKINSLEEKQLKICARDLNT